MIDMFLFSTVTMTIETKSRKKLGVGIVGYGNVGKGAVEYWYTSGNPELEGFKLMAIGVKDIARVRRIPGIQDKYSDDIVNKFPRPKITSNILEDIIMSPDIDIVIDVVGGDGNSNAQSMSYIREALKNGKQVITANKSNLAKDLAGLTELANQNRVNLQYEASVCGSIPIIQTIRNYFSNDNVKKVVGILNGTSNYILTQMHKGGSFEDALLGAQEAGFAEKDSSGDTGGSDAANKLAILTNIAFRTSINLSKIKVEGITNIDADDIYYVQDVLRVTTGKKYAIKPLAIAERIGNALDMRVHPAYISEDHPLFGIDNALNAVCLVGQYGETHVMSGKGAGPVPTGFAVISDLLQVGRKVRAGFVDNFSEFGSGIDNLVVPETSGYVEPLVPVTRGFIKSVSPEHICGVLAAKARILADNKISIRQWYNFINRETGSLDESLPDVFLIDPVSEERIFYAIEGLKEEECVLGDPKYLREDITKR